MKKGERERKYKGECDETRTEQKKKNRPTKKDEGKMPKIPERKIKMGKVVLKQDSRDRKTKGHHGKAKGQNQKASVLHRTDQAQPSKTNCFSLPTPLHSKIQADFLSKRPHFSRLPPLFYLKPPHPVQTPIQSYAQDTRLRVYTRSRSQRFFHFCLHPSPHPATNCRSIDCV